MSEYAADQYDPFAKLKSQQRALETAGSRGEAVGEQLTDVKNTIRSISDYRAETTSPPRPLSRGPRP